MKESQRALTPNKIISIRRLVANLKFATNSDIAPIKAGLIRLGMLFAYDINRLCHDMAQKIEWGLNM